MPGLAAHMKVGVTSIYWYFRRKEDLLDAMTDRALERYSGELPAVTVKHWDKTLREHGRAMRRLLRDDPVLCDLVVMRTAAYGASSSQKMMEQIESVLSTLIDVGFRPDDALNTYLSIALHTRGLAMLERQQDIDRESDIRVPGFEDKEKLPILVKLLKQGHGLGANEKTFEYGLTIAIEQAKLVLAKTERAAIARRERRGR